jgi:hypothetical protein
VNASEHVEHQVRDVRAERFRQPHPDGAARARVSALRAAEQYTADDMAKQFAKFVEPLL